MAENENKSEKKVVEMNIWAIICFIILIIASALVFALNSKLDVMQKQYDELNTKYMEKSSKYSEMVQNVLAVQSNIDNLTPNDLRARLLALTGEKVEQQVEVPQPTEPVVSGETSGEEVLAPSEAL